jgi:hypothetical protein
MKAWLVIVALTLAACAGGDAGSDAPSADLTQRQRDSILAQSRIPGAAGVGAALRASDAVEARLRRADSVGP